MGRYPASADFEYMNRITTVNLTPTLIKMIDVLVNKRVFFSRSEAVRQLLMEGLERKLEHAELFEGIAENIDNLMEPDNFVRVPNGDGTHKIYKLVKPK